MSGEHELAHEEAKRKLDWAAQEASAREWLERARPAERLIRNRVHELLNREETVRVSAELPVSLVRILRAHQDSDDLSAEILGALLQSERVAQAFTRLSSEIEALALCYMDAVEIGLGDYTEAEADAAAREVEGEVAGG